MPPIGKSHTGSMCSLDSIIKCNHKFGTWTSKEQAQVKRGQTRKKKPTKREMKVIKLVLKDIEWPDQLSMKRKGNMQVSLPLKKGSPKGEMEGQIDQIHYCITKRKKK